MSKLIIVSNKLPYEIIEKDGKPALTEKTGGISGSLNAFSKYSRCIWAGWTGNESVELDKKGMKEIHRMYRDKNCHPLELSSEEIDDHHHGFCNQTIWPLFHYFPQYSDFSPRYWEAYRRVNEKFADTVAEEAGEGDKIWIHDYHLMLLPAMIRKRKPDISIGFFMHIPFPSFEVMRIFPWRQELLEGMLGADLIGFHTFDYERHFMSCVRRLLGYDNILNTFKIDERVVKIDNFPMGIDFERIRKDVDGIKSPNGSRTDGFGRLFGRNEGDNGDRKIILSIDRLDYAKGIPQRLEAFEDFLSRNPGYLEKVSLALFVIPSREVVAEYQQQRRLVEELVGRINGEFGTLNWMPVLYYYRPVAREEMTELYTISDVALVTPLRDGMNLVAKEYIAARTEGTGVLILSEMAGAAKEMSEAILVNPYSNHEVASAIGEALAMAPGEQKKRLDTLQKRLKVYNEDKWAGDILNSLENVKELQATSLTKKVSKNISEEFCKKYSDAGNRVIFLDYDGTLTGFHNDPQKAMPDDELYSILRSLVADKNNHVVIISGRDKETLGKWFDEFDEITFIAEHGVWIREQGEEWSMIEQIDKEWMEIIRPTISFYVDRTPRSLLEEKNYSLVWHYRHSDPDLGEIRSWELKEELRDLVSNLNLEIMDGDKVIEVKNSGINKGRAAAQQLAKQEYDYIIAIGDDWTDEYTFGAMPGEAITIKVGTKSTRARYYTDSVESVRKLLRDLAGSGNGKQG
ncbi:MAG: bifunctional alpha,alpha-trehalose-phosphate synthase (UDP-forming)/trehalose-phosphatase [Marinilabiliales bacterium]|nr:MAG: bifunctional alpha,alpha-trehalose-phosphate synthase (UDP-forming)/trehalose-phosphatase [Marinilabiliales bacterium]